MASKGSRTEEEVRGHFGAVPLVYHLWSLETLRLKDLRDLNNAKNDF
jgi:hypothetical protein